MEKGGAAQANRWYRNWTRLAKSGFASFPPTFSTVLSCGPVVLCHIRCYLCYLWVVVPPVTGNVYSKKQKQFSTGASFLSPKLLNSSFSLTLVHSFFPPLERFTPFASRSLEALFSLRSFPPIPFGLLHRYVLCLSTSNSAPGSISPLSVAKPLTRSRPRSHYTRHVFHQVPSACSGGHSAGVR